MTVILIYVVVIYLKDVKLISFRKYTMNTSRVFSSVYSKWMAKQKQKQRNYFTQTMAHMGREKGH